MKLLVDENLPPRLARGLAALFVGEHEIKHIGEKFGRLGLKDEEWIEKLGAEGAWCVLSGDAHIAKQRPSRRLFSKSGLTGFFPASAVMKLPIERQAARILIMWPKMVAASESVAGGFYEIGISRDRLKPI